MKPTNTLNPIIKKALNSLDLQLENELQRYRQKRRKERAEGLVQSSYIVPQLATPLIPNQKPIPELIDLEKDANSPQPVLASVSYTSNLNLNPVSEQPRTHEGRDLKLPNFESSQSSKPKITTRISLEEISSLIHQPKETNHPEKSDVAEIENHVPKEYLESSEQLLASLQEEKIEVKEEAPKTNLNEHKNTVAKISFFKYLTTPLGVGSLLLLFVSSALLSSLILAPESFSYLGLNHLFLANQNKPKTDNLNNNNLTNNSNLVVPNGTNLTNEEFTPIQLENLSTLESNVKNVAPPVNNTPPKPTTSNTPTPIAPQTSPQTVPSLAPAPVLTNNQDLASVLLPPSLRPQNNQPYLEPPTLPPVPNSKINQPTNQNLNQRYLVVIPFSGDRSLEQVRQVVKEAFVRDFPDGKKIQIAAFDTQNEAQQFVQKLSRSGLSTSVYTLASR